MAPIPAPRLKYLVLGGGAVVAEFYLPAFEGLGWLDDVWVADMSKPALDRLTAAYPTINILQLDFEAALKRARELGIGAVIVALPNALHEPAVMLAFDCGLDVLCEKPLALTQAACDRLAGHAARTGRVLGVGMTRRFLPTTKALRAMLDAGWLGEIRSIEIQDGHNFAWSSESGAYGRPDNAGVVANIGVHALDLVEYFGGPLAPVSYSDDWHGGVEANATFELRTGSGAAVRVKVSYTHSLANGIRIKGTRGEAWVSVDGASVQFRSEDSGLSADVSLTEHDRNATWSTTLQKALREEFSDFADAISRRRPPCATAGDAARTAALIDWAYSHHSTSRLKTISLRDSSRPRLETGRIVVTGGTGFVGGHLIEALTDDGHQDLVVPVRTYQRSANSWRFPVQLRRTDLLDPASLREAMAGARYVFHLAYGRDGDNIARVTIEGTRNVIDAAIAVGAESVVVLSTTAVFGDPGGPGEVDESFPYDPPNREYEKTKAEAERLALDYGRRDSGTRIVVINPSCIYGPGGKTFTELPAVLLAEGSFCWIDDGQGLVNYVYVKNLVDAILRAAVHKEAHGKRFIVSDGSATWRAFFTELLGDAVADLPSYTKADLLRLDRESRPSLRDVARTVVQSDKLWPMVAQNPQLATTKAIFEKMTPGLYRRVKTARGTRQPVGAVATAAAGRARPPVYLADLFGMASTRLTAAKARATLGWSTRIDLAAGQAASRAWLAEIGLLPAGDGAALIDSVVQ